MTEGKTADRILTVQNSLLALMAVIMVCGVPWAYMIGNKVTAIEVTLSQSMEQKQELASLRTRVDRLRSEMDWMRGKAGDKPE